MWSFLMKQPSQRGGHPLAEFAHTLVETGTAVLEVDQEVVATGLHVLREPLDYPFRRAGDRVAAAFVAPDLGLRAERYADAAIGPPFAQHCGQQGELVRGKCDGVPDAVGWWYHPV